jgi:hypothetical protein
MLAERADGKTARWLNSVPLYRASMGGIEMKISPQTNLDICSSTGNRVIFYYQVRKTHTLHQRRFLRRLVSLCALPGSGGVITVALLELGIEWHPASAPPKTQHASCSTAC